jgi:hypothetical protein
MPISQRIEYTDLLRALGHFIQQEHLSEVSIVEFDRGWIVAGLTYKSTAQGFIRVPADFTLSHEQVHTLAEQLEQKRAPVPAKRGWLR